MKRLIAMIIGTVPVLAIGGAAFAQQPAMEAAKADVADKDGKALGTVEFTQTPNGVLVRAVLEGLPQGTHGFHLHAVGKCEPPFDSAGGHYNPTNAEHGFFSEGGPHAGDMVNLNVPESGAVTFETVTTMVTISGGENPLLDDDGSALVIHGGADDYTSQPAGDAGPRIGCGVIEASGG
ncbi:MAG: superoxide dismutase family protein [Hyphomicrobiales bacterium]|nr:superoxide dismutase family protein [Hyphomicrobiales bacterium]